MPFIQLSTHQFRNLSEQRLVLSPALNIFYGKNGSGKTSILEALYFLSAGKSFRTHKSQTATKHGNDAFILFSKQNLRQGERSVGLQRSKDSGLTIKVDGEIIHSISQLAQGFPALIIDPCTFDLLIGPPGSRRKYIDWGVFHVEHNYGYDWNVYNKCLKQRNTLLRHGKIDRSLLRAWESEMALRAERIDEFRRNYIEALIPLISGLLEMFALDIAIDISYQRGWLLDKDYLQTLDENFERDKLQKFTQSGPHRADLRIKVAGMSAQEVLSRGQQKIVVCAMVLAQALYLEQVGNSSYVLMIDDIGAELDKSNVNRFFELVSTLKAQVFITAVEKNIVLPLFETEKNKKMFHVEHGLISELID